MQRQNPSRGAPSASSRGNRPTVRGGSSSGMADPFLDDTAAMDLPPSRESYNNKDDLSDDGLIDLELEDDPNADPYELFDFDITADKHSVKTNKGQDLGGGDGTTLPVSSTWISSNVTIPNRLALITMGSIIGYEVLVVVSMGVNSLRSLMAAGLMYFLLLVNISLLLVLAVMVYKSKRQLNTGAITKRLKGDKRVVEDENNREGSKEGGEYGDDEFEEDDEVAIGNNSV